MEARGESSLRVPLDRTEVTPTGAKSGCMLDTTGCAPPCTGDRKGEPKPSGDDDMGGFSSSSSRVPFLSEFWGPGFTEGVREDLAPLDSASGALVLLLGCGKRPPM